MRSKPSTLRASVLACLLLCGCKDGLLLPPQVELPKNPAASTAEATASQPAPVAGTSAKTLERAEYIKSRIEKYKEWGGAHSPIPRRGINRNTFEKVRREISQTDTAALIILLQDDAYDMRSVVASLLECVEPNALPLVEDLSRKELNTAKKNRLDDAGRAIEAIRAGDTSCK